jgi:hypothetical protein
MYNKIMKGGDNNDILTPLQDISHQIEMDDYLGLYLHSSVGSSSHNQLFSLLGDL